MTVTELRALAASLTGMVDRVRSSRSSYTIEEFISSDRLQDGTGMIHLYPVQDYVRCFRALGVKDREELYALCKRRYGETAVREAADEFLQSEEYFGEFVAEVEEEVKKWEDKLVLGNVLVVGSKVPADLEVLDADSNTTVSLGAVLGRAPFTLFVFKRHYS